MCGLREGAGSGAHDEVKRGMGGGGVQKHKQRHVSGDIGHCTSSLFLSSLLLLSFSPTAVAAT